MFILIPLTLCRGSIVGPYSIFLLPVVNNPDSLFRCMRCIHKADLNRLVNMVPLFCKTCSIFLLIIVTVIPFTLQYSAVSQQGFTL